MTSFLNRTSEHPIEELLLARWSPRAFTGEAIPHETLMSIFEAARWAPSSYNSQPWRLVYALNDAFTTSLDLLNPFNQLWVKKAAALVFIASKTTMSPRGTLITSHSHSFDAGAAWQNMGLQATALGWQAHGMTGFDIPRAALQLGLPEDHRLEASFAIGKYQPGKDPEEAGETPSGRDPISSFVFEGRFPAA